MIRRLLHRASTALVCLLAVTAAKPCGPFIPTFNQVVQTLSDGSEEDWVAGRIGLIQPGLHTADLVIAWRWLSGVGLSAEEQKVVLQGPYGSRLGAEEWQKARAEVGAPPLDVKEFESGPDYTSSNRIGNHALVVAADTLRARAAEFGKQSAAVKAWLAAQDRVFAWDKPELPPEAGSDLPLRIRQDRAYQRAAALHYRQRSAEAAQVFAAVAEDKANPWHGWARYRLALMGIESLEEGTPELASTLASFQAIQDTNRDPELCKAAAAQENRLRYKVDPVSFYPWLLANLARKNRGIALAQDIEDLRWLRMMEPWTLKLKNTQPAGVHAWINQVQKGSLEDALATYDKRSGMPELVVVMMRMKPDHPRCEVFLKLAQAASQGPAYATLVHHRLRLLVAQNRMKAAEALAAEALNYPDAKCWPSSLNLWSSLKAACAKDVDALAAHLGRRLVSIDEGYGLFGNSEHPGTGADAPDRITGLDPAVVGLLNQQLPLAQWEALLAAPHFPKELKPEFLEVLWCRAAILDREDVQMRHRTALALACPKLAQDLAAWAAEKDGVRRRALAFLLIWEHRLWPQLLAFRREAFQYDTLYARWMGPLKPGGEAPPYEPDPSAPLPGLASYGVKIAVPFLDAASRQTGVQEAAHIPAPLTWFCTQALAFAEARPQDPLVPEALSRAVQSSRKANRDEQSAALVVKAFRLLHKKYPDSAGAKAAKVYH